MSQPAAVRADDWDGYQRRLAEHRSRPLTGRARVLPAALALVVRTAPARAAAVLALEASASLLATAQVLAAAALVARVLAVREGSGAGAAAAPLAALAAVLVVGGLVSATSPRAQRLLGERVAQGVQDRVLDVTSRVPLVAYDTAGFSDVLERVRQHGLDRPVVVATSLARLLGGLLTSAALVVYLVGVHWSLPLLAVLAGAPSLVSSRVLGRREFAFGRRQSPLLRRRWYAGELLVRREHAKEVRSFALGSWLRERHRALGDQALDQLRHHLRGQALLQSGAALATGVLTAATLLALVLLLDAGRVGLAQAAGAALALRLLAGRAQASAGAAGGLHQSGLFLDDLQRFLDHPVVEEAPTSSAVLLPAPREVELRGVSFTYPGAAAPSLHGVDLHLRPGRVVALVGENGSGKTTLAKLVAQLYAPTRGAVLWDGREVAPEERPLLRERIAVLFQDFGQYAMSASDNVVIGRTGAAGDAERRDRAATTAGADEVVAQLPGRWGALLGPEFAGQDLSRGQWQRVALARAHFREADVVVLDEPTAALDPRAEARLFDDLRTVLAGRTVLLVTHRLASARSADHVVVLHAGRVVEQGTHDALVDAGGTYADLWRVQAAGYAGAVTPS